jgi:two-component system, OmpR family, response regulator
MKTIRVLIIDDEPDFLETLVKRLQKRKFDAVGVGSGEAALHLIEEQSFDVAILDMRMPGMDGIDTLKELKKKAPLMEVIMLTGHASVESGMQGMQIGAFDYVIKPADFDDLIEKVDQAYQRKALHEEKVRKSG